MAMNFDNKIKILIPIIIALGGIIAAFISRQSQNIMPTVDHNSYNSGSTIFQGGAGGNATGNGNGGNGGNVNAYINALAHYEVVSTSSETLSDGEYSVLMHLSPVGGQIAPDHLTVKVIKPTNELISLMYPDIQPVKVTCGTGVWSYNTGYNYDSVQNPPLKPCDVTITFQHAPSITPQISIDP